MKLRSLFSFALLTTLLLAGCGGATPTPTPTPAPTAPPTDTPIPAPPTATRPPPTATRADVLPQAVAFALNKTQNARSMQFDFESAVSVTEDGKTSKMPGLAIRGADSTLNRSVVISGTTTDTNEFITYDVIVLGNQVFIKGLVGVPGIDPEQWYELPEASQTGVRRLPTARGLIASFDPAEVGKAEFQASGTDELDGEKCTVWTAQNANFARQLIGVTEESDLRKQLGEIESSEFKIWTCADGFIHQMSGTVNGHAADNPANAATVTLKFLMSDFDSAVDIEAPTDVKPFPAPPSQAQPTPEPTLSEAQPTPEPTLSEAQPTPEPTASEAQPTPEPTASEEQPTEPAVSPTENVEPEASPTP